MRTLLVAMAVLGLLVSQALGQGAQADQIKRRAKELSNQNNVRQGVAPPTQRPASQQPTAPKSSATNPAASSRLGSAKIQADIAGLKPGSLATPEQKQQLIKDLAVACRGAKPSLPAVTTFVNELTAALADKTLDSARQARLAQNIEAVLNSASMPSAQFDAIIADVQAILQTGSPNRNLAASVAGKLKAVGLEARKGSAR